MLTTVGMGFGKKQSKICDCMLERGKKKETLHHKIRLFITILPHLPCFACACGRFWGQSSAVPMKGSGAVLTTLNRTIGLPVVWQDKQLGYVEKAAADVKGACLSGLVVRKGIGVARWAQSEDVLLIGRRCVVIGRKPGRMPDVRTELLRRAFLTTGECVGEVTDTVIDGRTFRIAALEICQGPLYQLAGQRSYAADFHLNTAGEPGEVVVPELLSWAQLLKQLGEEEQE